MSSPRSGRAVRVAIVALLSGSCDAPPYDLRPVASTRHPNAIHTGDRPVLPALRGVNGQWFATSASCAWCHSNAPSALAMRGPDGAKRAADDQWRPSLHAQSARDPIFRAAVSRESEGTPPERRTALEHDCLRCHAPMLARYAEADHETAALSRLYADDEAGHLGRDGVSCTVCHQIEPGGLGTAATFGGRFSVGTARRAYGPHAQPEGRSMQSRVRYEPVHGAHVSSSALCGTCHASQPGPTPSVATYLEWRNSGFDRERPMPGPQAASCQECHMPRHDHAGQLTPTRIARDLGGGDDRTLPTRPWISRHAAAGGNAFALAILRDHSRELRPPADPEELDLAIGGIQTQLRERTASVELAELSREPGALSFRVEVRTKVGHKLPTGTPGRRAWLRVRVGRSGSPPTFASGEVDGRGRILAAGALHPCEAPRARPEPHRDSIDAASQVQIYEAVPADEAGTAHDRLTGTARWLKDNRLLPAGWSAAHADAAATAPVGTATDPDFAAGGDAVRYRMPVPPGDGPIAIEVELLYQPLAPRWGAAYGEGLAAEAAHLRHLLEGADWTPIRLARAAKILE